MVLRRPHRREQSPVMQAEQIPLNLGLDKHACFDSFYSVGNELSLALLKELLHEKSKICYLYGHAGSGKSHLSQALCFQAGQEEIRCTYIPLSQTSQLSPQILANVDGFELICFDDIHSIAGDRVWEEGIFNAINSAREQKATVLFTANSRPRDLPLSLADLKSRLSWGTVIRLQQLDDVGRVKALQLRARIRGLELKEQVANYLIQHFGRSMSQLLELLDRLDSAAFIEQRKITIPLIKQILGKDL